MPSILHTARAVAKLSMHLGNSASRETGSRLDSAGHRTLAPVALSTSGHHRRLL